MHIVYEHINKINGKKYIGITSKKNPNERWEKDGKNYKSAPHFYSAIQKYGWNNFGHTILYAGLIKEQACEIEKQLIKKYKTQNNKYEYNILSGGEITELPQSVRDKISIGLKGNKNGQGHPCAEEKKRKISESQKGRTFTDEHKRKLPNATKKRHASCSIEKRKKLSENYPNKKSAYCLETDTIYESIQECARQLNLHPSLVSKVCKKKMHTTGGYHLSYYSE